MGQKVDPRGIRLGITRTWDSKWFAEGKEYVNNFHEDLKIKEYVKKNYYHAGISSIQIERTSPTEVAVIIETGKAGIFSGKSKFTKINFISFSCYATHFSSELFSIFRSFRY